MSHKAEPQERPNSRQRKNVDRRGAPVSCRGLRARASALCLLIGELVHSGRRQLVNGHSSSHSLVASTDTSSAAERGCVSRRRPGDEAVIGPIRRSAATESTLIGVWSEKTIAVVQLQTARQSAWMRRRGSDRRSGSGARLRPSTGLRAETPRKRGWSGGPGIFAHTLTFEFRQSGWVSDLCVRSLGVTGPAGGAGQAEKGRKYEERVVKGEQKTQRNPLTKKLRP